MQYTTLSKIKIEIWVVISPLNEVISASLPILNKFVIDWPIHIIGWIVANGQQLFLILHNNAKDSCGIQCV